MSQRSTISRRKWLKRLNRSLAGVVVWTTPVVQSVLIPAHAQSSPDAPVVPVVCTRDDIPGVWQLALFGQAASTSEITFYDDGTADHNFINAWRFENNQLLMTQGTTWVLNGTFSDCDTLSGTYLNVFTIPPFGVVIIRHGDWHMKRGRSA